MREQRQKEREIRLKVGVVGTLSSLCSNFLSCGTLGFLTRVMMQCCILHGCWRIGFYDMHNG